MTYNVHRAVEVKQGFWGELVESRGRTQGDRKRVVGDGKAVGPNVKKM